MLRKRAHTWPTHTQQSTTLPNHANLEALLYSWVVLRTNEITRLDDCRNRCHVVLIENYTHTGRSLGSRGSLARNVSTVAPFAEFCYCVHIWG